MSFKRLFIWVEGPDDVRFFETVIGPIVAKRYDWVDIVPYAAMPPEKIHDFIDGINAMGADYLFVRDINSLPCATAAKADLVAHIFNLDPGSLLIVMREIESWYLATLNRNKSRRLGFSHPGSTDDITKEQFNALIPRRFASRVDFMIEILELATTLDATTNLLTTSRQNTCPNGDETHRSSMQVEYVLASSPPVAHHDTQIPGSLPNLPRAPMTGNVKIDLGTTIPWALDQILSLFGRDSLNRELEE